jgi:hypothetical protein
LARIVTAADGQGIEHLHGLYLPDRFTFHVDIARRQHRA